MRDLIFEGSRTVDGEPITVTLDCEPQSGLQAVVVRAARYIQAIAVIAHGGRAEAIDYCAFLSNAVLRGMSICRRVAALAGDGVALKSLRRLSGAQRA